MVYTMKTFCYLWYGITRTYFNQIENITYIYSYMLKEALLKELECFNPQKPLFILVDYFRVRFSTTDTLSIIKNISHINPKYMLY